MDIDNLREREIENLQGKVTKLRLILHRSYVILLYRIIAIQQEKKANFFRC